MRRGPRERRRVVVTGLGCVTPLGGDVASTWDAAVAGRCGVGADRPLRHQPTSRCASPREVPGELDLGDLSAKEARRLDRVDRCSRSPPPTRRRPTRASTLPTRSTASASASRSAPASAASSTLLEGHRALPRRRGPRRVSPFMIPMTIANMASGYVVDPPRAARAEPRAT